MDDKKDKNQERVFIDRKIGDRNEKGIEVISRLSEMKNIKINMPDHRKRR